MEDEKQKAAAKQALDAVKRCIDEMPDPVTTPILCAAVATLVSAYDDNEEEAITTLSLAARAIRDYYRAVEAKENGLH